jgi:hypothetical protein
MMRSGSRRWRGCDAVMAATSRAREKEAEALGRLTQSPVSFFIHRLSKLYSLITPQTPKPNLNS